MCGSITSSLTRLSIKVEGTSDVGVTGRGEDRIVVPIARPRRRIPILIKLGSNARKASTMKRAPYEMATMFIWEACHENVTPLGNNLLGSASPAMSALRHEDRLYVN